MNILLLEEGERQIPAGDRRYRHIRKILKLRNGDTIRSGIINGSLATATITSLTSTSVTLTVSEQSDPPSLAPVDIVLGHPRPIVLRRLLRDLTTVGARRIVVAPTDLGERSYLDATIWENIRPLLIEGAEQAGTTRLPEVVRCRSLRDAIDCTSGEERLRIALHPVSVPHFADLLGERISAAGAVVAVGSERGWVDREIEQLSRAGYLLAHLGPRILKTETAALLVAWGAITAWNAARPE